MDKEYENKLDELLMRDDTPKYVLVMLGEGDDGHMTVRSNCSTESVKEMLDLAIETVETGKATIVRTQ